MARHGRDADRQLRVGAPDGGRRRARRSDDLRRRRRARAPVRRDHGVGPAQPAQLRVVAHEDGPERRGLPRRPRGDVAGAAGADARAAGVPHHVAVAGGRRSTCSPRAVGHSPRGDGGALLYLFEMPEGSLLFQDTSGHWTGILDGLRPGRGHPRRGRARQHRRRADPRLAGRVRRPAGRRACGRDGCCSATTTTGCPASPCRRRWSRCARRSAPRRPDTELLEPGYLAGTDPFG